MESKPCERTDEQSCGKWSSERSGSYEIKEVFKGSAAARELEGGAFRAETPA